MPQKTKTSNVTSVKYKIAVHMTGAIRGYKSIKSIYKYIIIPTNADLFLDAQIPIKEAKINQNSKYNNPITNNLKPMLYRMHKLQESFDEYIRCNNIHYDIVIRIRPDMVLTQYIDNKYYDEAASGKFVSALRHPYAFWIGKDYSPSDTIFMSNLTNMRLINNSYVIYKDKFNNTIMGEDIINDASKLMDRVFMLDLEYILENIDLEKLNMASFALSKFKAHILGN